MFLPLSMKSMKKLNSSGSRISMLYFMEDAVAWGILFRIEREEPSRSVIFEQILEGVRERARPVSGEECSCQGNCYCTSPEVGTCLLSLRNSKKAGVARVELERWRVVVEDEVREVVGSHAYYIDLASHCKFFAFLL